MLFYNAVSSAEVTMLNDMELQGGNILSYHSSGETKERKISQSGYYYPSKVS
jgi:hypothetical protein